MMDLQELDDEVPKLDLEALLPPVETLDWEYVLKAQDNKRELKAIALEVVIQVLETAIQVHETTVHQAHETMVIETQNTSVNPLLPSPALVAHLPPPVETEYAFHSDLYQEFLQAQEQGQAYSRKRLRDDDNVDESFEVYWREFVQGKIIQ